MDEPFDEIFAKVFSAMAAQVAASLDHDLMSGYDPQPRLSGTTVEDCHTLRTSIDLQWPMKLEWPK